MMNTLPKDVLRLYVNVHIKRYKQHWMKLSNLLAFDTSEE